PEALIDLTSVVFNHAIAVVLRSERLNRPFHHSDPIVRKSIAVTMVKKRYDSRFQRPVKRFGIDRINLLNRRIDRSITNRKPVCSVVSSSHQPSRIEKFKPPLIATFSPLVPEASCGRRGTFNQTSTDWTNWRAIS